MSLKKQINDNRKERIEFVETWANYILTQPTTIWFPQHKSLIDSMFHIANSSKLTPKEYLKIKGEMCFRL